MQARLRGRTLRLDFGDRQRVRAGLDAGAEPGRLGHLRYENFRERLGHLFDRNGEPDAVTLAVNRHVESDEFATKIEERAAAAARVDGRVGLEPVGNVQRLSFQRRTAVFRTQNAAADRAAQTERVAQRQHRFTQQQIVVHRKVHRLEFFYALGNEFEQRHVPACVAHDWLGFKFTAIGQRHPDRAGASHDVKVGEHVAVFINDDAGAEAVLGVGLPPLIVRSPELAQHLSERVVVLHDRRRGDVHDAGHDPFHRFHGGVAPHVRLQTGPRRGRQRFAPKGGQHQPQHPVLPE